MSEVGSLDKNKQFINPPKSPDLCHLYSVSKKFVFRPRQIQCQEIFTADAETDNCHQLFNSTRKAFRTIHTDRHRDITNSIESPDPFNIYPVSRKYLLWHREESLVEDNKKSTAESKIKKSCNLFHSSNQTFNLSPLNAGNDFTKTMEPFKMSTSCHLYPVYKDILFGSLAIPSSEKHETASSEFENSYQILKKTSNIFYLINLDIYEDLIKIINSSDHCKIYPFSKKLLFWSREKPVVGNHQMLTAGSNFENPLQILLNSSSKMVDTNCFDKFNTMDPFNSSTTGHVRHVSKEFHFRCRASTLKSEHDMFTDTAKIDECYELLNSPSKVFNMNDSDTRSGIIKPIGFCKKSSPFHPQPVPKETRFRSIEVPADQNHKIVKTNSKLINYHQPLNSSRKTFHANTVDTHSDLMKPFESYNVFTLCQLQPPSTDNFLGAQGVNSDQDHEILNIDSKIKNYQQLCNSARKTFVSTNLEMSYDLTQQIKPVKAQTPCHTKAASKYALSWSPGLPSGRELEIFTDGSKSERGVGIAYCCFIHGSLLDWDGFKMSDASTILEAESLAILKALDWALDCNVLCDIKIFSDSQYALQDICNETYATGTVDDIRMKICSLPTTVELHWVKSHSGVLGNELADLLSKEAATQVHPDFRYSANPSRMRPQLQTISTVSFQHFLYMSDSSYFYSSNLVSTVFGIYNTGPL